MSTRYQLANNEYIDIQDNGNISWIGNISNQVRAKLWQRFNYSGSYTNEEAIQFIEGYGYKIEPSIDEYVQSLGI